MPSTPPLVFYNRLRDLALARAAHERPGTELAAVLAKRGLEWVD